LASNIICLLLANPTISTAKNKQGFIKYATTTVNIRAKPNTHSKIVGRIGWNTGIRLIKRINKKWYLCRYKNKNRYIYAAYLTQNKSKYISYSSPSSKSFKSYEDASCITNNTSLGQGKLKQSYHLDSSTGVYMVGDRYCVAVGSYYTKTIGKKIDLVLSVNGKKHVLKCIAADSKADKDTVNNHRVHKDGSVAEFIVHTSSLSSMARRMGDVSYTGSQFRGSIVEIRVYK
jgi:hypothetical protein